MSKRTTITNRERLALRNKHKSKPHLTQLQLKDWFKEEYHQEISKTTVSRVLSVEYDWLDTAKDYQLNAKKIRTENWPELEKALHEWIQLAENKSAITQELIRQKARQFWPYIYPEKQMPGFSNGWLHGFQNRRHARSPFGHDEAGSVSTDADENLIEIRELVKQYPPRDIFNCNETSLFWKSTPDKSFTTGPVPVQENDDAQISLHFCTNSDASERLPLWIIGNSQKPQAFHAAKTNIENLGCCWRYNKKAWMTETIFKEWLIWFDKKMAGRKVLLMMDHFSSHISAVRKVLSRLKNTKIVWLPIHSKSKYQPLDQGIISTWKAYWRRQWLFYMIQEFNNGRNPMETVTILMAIRWAIKAWEVDVSDKTIKDCFEKALVCQGNAEVDNSQLLQEIQACLDFLKISHIKEIMTINEFLNPAKEEVADNLDDLDNFVLSQFCDDEGTESSDDDGDLQVLPRISAAKALEAFYTIRLFEEQQPVANQNVLKVFLRYESELIEKSRRDKNQTDIRDFLRN